MTQSEFKNSIKDRVKILRINLQNSIQLETAYIFNNWGNAFSTSFYIIAYLIFINVIYSNIKTFGGYSKNEMFLLLLISQIGFYFSYFLSRSNLEELIDDVNTGQLDFTLTKPVPSLFFTSFKRINIISLLTDSFAPILIIIILIDWSKLHSINIKNTIFSIIIFTFGQIALNGFEFLFAVPVFWLGRSTNIYYTAWSITGGVNEIPYDALTKPLKILFSSIIPCALIGVACTSVLLGKQNGEKILLLSFAMALIFMAVKIFIWKLALRSYTSASS